MKKVLLVLAFVGLLTSTIVSCEPEDINETTIENATDKDCTPSGGNKCDK